MQKPNMQKPNGSRERINVSGRGPTSPLGSGALPVFVAERPPARLRPPVRTPPTPRTSFHRAALTPGAVGFALPTVLVIVSALLILALGMLLLVGTERSTARSYVDSQRADLAVRAGLAQFMGILTSQAANDTFTILQAVPTESIKPGRSPAPLLFLAQGKKVGGEGFTFHYTPLFSATAPPPETGWLNAPEVAPLVSTAAAVVLETLPYLDPVRAAWVPVFNEKKEMVARYAFWVEDLQGKIDPKTAGNIAGPGEAHAGTPFPFPAPGLNPLPASPTEPALDRISLHAVDPLSTAETPSALGKTLIGHRPLLLTPDSVLAAATLQPPLTRDALGHLLDPTARAVEENLATTLQPYLEQPRVPFAPGIDASVVGEPKLNLNALLASGPEGVDQMAAFIKKSLPEFETRGGGFPDDYLKTLAANAIDYADSDTQSNLAPGSHRGLDAFPLLSELFLQINYLGIETINHRKILNWRFRLFAELWNMTNQDVSGNSRLSYEVALPMEGLGAGTAGKRFDDPTLLSDATKSTHQLVNIDGRFWTPEIPVALKANEYKEYEFASVTYQMDVGPESIFIVGPIYLTETLGASGCSLRWNDQEVDRIPAIVRQKYGLSFDLAKPSTQSKATVAALSFGPYTQVPEGYRNNPGDPRASYYLRSMDFPCAENSSPENTSPNRRNIRRSSIYNDIRDPSPRKLKTYGRVLPSEWPDGGHDSPVGSWNIVTEETMIPTDPSYNWTQNPLATQAPQRLSNLGRFYSATELGRLYDPLMWRPTYDAPEDTTAIRTGLMPASRFAWPDVLPASPPSTEHGGGNTLRIGRPEHPAFDHPGKRASHLLDLFHAGQSRAEETDRPLIDGNLVEIRGHLNLNTATRDALRALAAGALQQDPLLATTPASGHHQDSPLMAPPATTATVYAPSAATKTEADLIADAILRSRPFASTAEVAQIKGLDGKPVFGNPDLYQSGGQLPANTRLQWTDAAAEETFARVYEAATVRSRNFRVWVVGQAINPVAVTVGSPASPPEVLAEVRKVFTLFADPGKRADDGTIAPQQFHPSVIHEREF
ncbi:MAG: hypothetical protein RLZZ522_567 [Verrucomicrobiota bacterium]